MLQYMVERESATFMQATDEQILLGLNQHTSLYHMALRSEDARTLLCRQLPQCVHSSTYR